MGSRSGSPSWAQDFKKWLKWKICSTLNSPMSWSRRCSWQENHDRDQEILIMTQMPSLREIHWASRMISRSGEGSWSRWSRPISNFHNSELKSLKSSIDLVPLSSWSHDCDQGLQSRTWSWPYHHDPAINFLTITKKSNDCISQESQLRPSMSQSWYLFLYKKN